MFVLFQVKAVQYVVRYVINVYDITEMRHNILVLEIEVPLAIDIDPSYAHLLILPNDINTYTVVIVSKQEIIYFDDVVLIAQLNLNTSSFD